MKTAILFGLATGLLWGFYGSALANGRAGLGSPWKPYVMIGVAYLVWGIIGGLIGMKAKGEAFSFAGMGSLWSFIAGSLGAFGALALTMAMVSGGAKAPHIVMACVFGSAVVVAGIVGVLQTGGSGNSRLYLGILLVTAGIILVAYNTPSPHKPPSPQVQK